MQNGCAQAQLSVLAPKISHKKTAVPGGGGTAVKNVAPGRRRGGSVSGCASPREEEGAGAIENDDLREEEEAGVAT